MSDTPSPQASLALAEPVAAQRPTLLLVDGSSYLYRAYHAMPDLRGPDGFPTGAIHGMVAMMKRLREQVLGAGQGGAMGHAACVFDASGPTLSTPGTLSTVSPISVR